MGEKVGFTNCVFEKLCFSENTIFIVLSEKHRSCIIKTLCWKSRKFKKIVGCFRTWQKVFFWFVFFSGFNVIVVCFFVCLVKLQECQTCLLFPSSLGFCGVAYSCLFGFGRFRCFCGSCMCVFFCSGFAFVCFGFVFVLLWIVVGVVLVFCFFVFSVFVIFSVFLFLVFVFRVRRGGPKGHLTWP